MSTKKVVEDKKRQEYLSKKILTNTIVGIYSKKYPEVKHEDIFWKIIKNDLGKWLNEGKALNSAYCPKLKDFFKRFDDITLDDYVSDYIKPIEMSKDYIKPIEMSNKIFEKMKISEFQEFIQYIYKNEK